MARAAHALRLPPARRSAAAALLALALAGCGGGFFVGLGNSDQDFFDEPPDIDLVASPQSAAPDDTVRLTAAASDDEGIDEVAFFRSSSGGAVPLGSDDSRPFELDTVVPSDASGTLRYFARATDTAGQQTDSDEVSVTVTP